MICALRSARVWARNQITFGSRTEPHLGQEQNRTQVGNQTAIKPKTKLNLDPRTKLHLDPSTSACACASVCARGVCLCVKCGWDVP